ncbi:hypothetical protein E3N88_34808 [Mikania micrantha]|uniref:Uncharacterized protein n=1 Tax=Mikania micrantha TaxID=192012 RepID=A0A5N6LZC2_9ASTR|nr:hypothetical protein E3N88_34808 [Mikania micrantha]
MKVGLLGSPEIRHATRKPTKTLSRTPATLKNHHWKPFLHQEKLGSEGLKARIKEGTHQDHHHSLGAATLEFPGSLGAAHTPFPHS